MTLAFTEFINQKQRAAKKKLGLVKKLLENSGFKVEDKTNEADQPYIFVYSPLKNLSFDGVRVYEIGGKIAYRIQKEKDTQPFGRAYQFPVEEIFEELLGEDDLDDDKIGEEMISALSQELKNFFKKNAEADKQGNSPADSLNNIRMRSTGTDYGSNVMKSF